ncbi:MAG: hypothetical protein ACFFDN_52335, partial [Candidatus Hodarchaeota archaeon]
KQDQKVLAPPLTKSVKSTQIQPIPKSITIPKSDNLVIRISNLENRINTIEKKIDNLISPYKKIKLKHFKSQLIEEYEHLNPLNDISGVEFEILRRRVCRELQIPFDYFDDLIYDLQKNEKIISIQSGREKKYIQIKKG